jgi:cell division protein FtsB
MEELQTYGNRMEAGLEDKQDMHRYHDEAKKVHVELKALRMEKEELEAEIAEMGTVIEKNHQIEYLHKQKMKLTREVNKLQNEQAEHLDIDEGIMGLGGLW